MKLLKWLKRHIVGLTLTGAFYLRHGIGHLYSRYLMHIRKDGYILTEEAFRHIKSCSIQAYPDDSCDAYADYASAEEWCNSGIYCDGLGQVYAFTGDNWYLLVVRHLTYLDITDFASASGKCTDLALFVAFFKTFSGNKCFMSCRERTSYPLILLFERLGRIEILKDKPVMRENEVYHIISMRILSNRKKKTAGICKKKL